MDAAELLRAIRYAVELLECGQPASALDDGGLAAAGGGDRPSMAEPLIA